MRSVLALVMVCGLGCGPLFGPAEAKQVGDNQLSIDKCEEIARACKADGGEPHGCYAQYEACLTDAGLQ